MASDDETSPSSFQPYSLPRRDRPTLLASLPRLIIPGGYQTPAETAPDAALEVSSSARSTSPARSVLSYDVERDASRLLKEMLGRCFNATNDLYALPAGACLPDVRRARRA